MIRRWHHGICPQFFSLSGTAASGRSVAFGGWVCQLPLLHRERSADSLMPVCCRKESQAARPPICTPGEENRARLATSN